MDRIIDIETILPWLIAATMLLIGFIMIRILYKVIIKVLKKSSLDSVLHEFIGRGFMVVCGIVLIGTALSYAGVPVSTFITVLGVVGAAIALSLKDSLGNIAGGVAIMISKPFKKGDFIEVDQIIGEVQQIDLLFTKLLTLDNRAVHIPNGHLSSSIIMNYSSEPKRRIDCRFGIRSTSDISKAKEILWEIALQSDLLFKEPEPMIGVFEQSNGIVFIDMKVWFATGTFWEVKYFLEETVKIAFDEAGIEMSAPHINIHTKK